MTAANRETLFDRVFDYEAKTVTIKDAKGGVVYATLGLADIAQAVAERFALAGAANYIINSATSAAKRKEDPVPFADGVSAAAERVRTGQIAQPGDGSANLSAAAVLGQALLSLGKSFIVFNGQKWTFSTADEATEACRSLYEAEGTMTAKLANGSTKTFTGRQFFNALQEIPDVAAEINKIKAKREVVVSDLLG